MSSQKAAIRRKVHGFFFNIEIPTIDQTLITVNDNLELVIFKRTAMYQLLNFTNEEETAVSENETVLCCGIYVSEILHWSVMSWILIGMVVPSTQWSTQLISYMFHLFHYMFWPDWPLSS
jgi:hypothetical protein